ncbi:single-stranded DNA-binding protein [Streptomyces caniscabiei]|uniref:single-stranded DNA-binding protein n=1 Tax=Streptomyces caniscabiei TaxID=2746961 RepID=UPI0029B7E877|nr:single-stranded DNA-binding protein [Streptomyces caniscabiei]MDX2601609.1 single-stranded DNA-binding protein [Streptomyces caniscabiei]MDX2741813.1 single-stranded DNA-binding protein [Streptomyces caniscabiei]MDX2781547.1 single-stranded DNA-binding protein [Streptomyces caniscabiei]
MSFGETPITLVGNLTDDPELKFTEGGAALAKFTIAVTPRSFDRNSNQWKDGTTAFYRCAAWRTLAEHVAESLAKGSRVVASGRMRQHDWTTTEGDKRSMLAVEVDDIGASVRFTTVQINARRPAESAPSGDDPWAKTGTPAGAPSGDEPPF